MELVYKGFNVQKFVYLCFATVKSVSFCRTFFTVAKPMGGKSNSAWSTGHVQENNAIN